MSFQEGDAVIRAAQGFTSASGNSINANHIGTICRVVTPGRLYRVRFNGVSICVLQYEDSLAPSSQAGPACGNHASCTG